MLTPTKSWELHGTTLKKLEYSEKIIYTYRAERFGAVERDRTEPTIYIREEQGNRSSGPRREGS